MGDEVPGQMDVINAKPGRVVVLRMNKPIGKVVITVRDCRSRSVSEEMRELSAGARVFDVLPSGLLEIRRNAPSK